MPMHMEGFPTASCYYLQGHVVDTNWKRLQPNSKTCTCGIGSVVKRRRNVLARESIIAQKDPAVRDRSNPENLFSGRRKRPSRNHHALTFHRRFRGRIY